MNEKCAICKTPFDNELHANCGGDCLLCMAEAGDPDCLKFIREAAAKKDQRIEILQRRLDETCESEKELAAKVVKLTNHRAALLKELIPCQNVLFQLARSGQCTPAYADGAKAVLQRVTGGNPPTFDDKNADCAGALECQDQGCPSHYAHFTQGFNESR